MNNILGGYYYAQKSIKCTSPELLFCETLGAPSTEKVLGVSGQSVATTSPTGNCSV